MDYSTKQTLLLNSCKYKMHHFCDGTPNTSVLKGGENLPKLKPCPERFNCPIRAVSIFDRRYKGD